MILILAAALLGCHNGGTGNGPDDTSNPGTNDTGNGPDDSGKSGTAFLTYDFTVMGEIEDCQINLLCDERATYYLSPDDEEPVVVEANTPFSVPTGTVVEVEAPALCSLTAGLEDYVDEFGFPVHLGNDGEYWASPELHLSLEPDDALTGEFKSFNLFRPGDYVCWYDEYQLDESAPDLKGEQRGEHREIDKQFVSVLQDGVVEAEDNPNMSVIGRDDDHMQVVDDQLVLVVASGGNPYYIDGSDIGVNYFNLTVVNTEAGYVADVWCELDE